MFRAIKFYELLSASFISWFTLCPVRGHPHKAGHLCNRCSAGSRPALLMPVLPIGKAEQLSALHLSHLMWVAPLGTLYL